MGSWKGKSGIFQLILQHRFGNAFSSVQREGNSGGKEEGKGNPDIAWNLLPPSGARAGFPFGSRGFQAKNLYFPAVKSLDPNLEMGMG